MLIWYNISVNGSQAINKKLIEKVGKKNYGKCKRIKKS